MNKINGVAGNLLKGLIAKVKYNEFITKGEQMQKKLSKSKIEFNKCGFLKISASIVIGKDYFTCKTKVLIYNTLVTRYYVFILWKTAQI